MAGEIDVERVLEVADELEKEWKKLRREIERALAEVEITEGGM